MLTPLSALHSPLYNDAVGIVRRLREAGYTAVFAGGCVRDALRGTPIKDIDIATSATPEEVAALFPVQSVGVGASFGVMLVVLNGVSYDVATFRTDGGYQDGRHPDSITYDTAEHDALRRDFTVNALFYDPIEARIIDIVGGVSDLENGILRTVGDPFQRFREDRLRMLRAIRFASVCGWAIESKTWDALCHEAAALGCVSMERIRTEFLRMLCEAPVPSKALELLAESGLLAQFFPELMALRGCLQDPQWHPEGDVWVHTVKMLDLLSAPREPRLVWSVLLHDIAKPQALIVTQKPDGSPWYRTPNHARMGAERVPELLRRFKESCETIETVKVAVEHHMQFVELPKMKRATIRKMLGRPTIALELELHRLDCLSSHAKLDLYECALDYLAQFKDEPVLPPALVTGRDLLAFGYPPGPRMGKYLKSLYNRQLEGISHEELLLDVLNNAPANPAQPRKVCFLYGPDKDFPMTKLYQAFCKHSAWKVTLVILPGRYWDPSTPTTANVLRLVTDCAGNVEMPDLTAYPLVFPERLSAL